MGKNRQSQKAAGDGGAATQQETTWQSQKRPSRPPLP